MAINYRLRYISENGRLYDPFGTRAHAHEYAVLMKLNGYEVMDEETISRLHSPEQLSKVRPLGITKS